MNIFSEKIDFIGRYEKSREDTSLSSLFSLAKRIRNNLGEQGYLVDYYLSLFFDGIYGIHQGDIADSGSSSAQIYQRLCSDNVDSKKQTKEHPLYDLVLNLKIKEIQTKRFHQEHTQMNFRYAQLADIFLDDAVNKFIKEQETILHRSLDTIELVNVYNQISQIIGEPLMESLNLKLKQTFLRTPVVNMFIQGFTNDLIDRLTTRDMETNKQIFQLVLDCMPDEQ